MAASDSVTTLMDEVLAHIAANGFPPDVRRGAHRKAPAPLAAKTLGALTLSDGAPLPTALARLFAYDAAWLGTKVDQKAARLESLTFGELLARDHEELAEYILSGTQKILPGACYPLVLPERCNEASLIFAYQAPGTGQPSAGGASGDLPVLLIDVQDSPILIVFAPSIAEYLALITDVITAKSLAKANVAVLGQIVGKARAKRIRQGVYDLPFDAG
ncbi:MAG: hypothetical protein KC593_01395 [Myxococcales bacterium]|nr:hypothetical protein [Myxococcales bacterium]MCB9628409.1 hypothetical protein [Sandaracinaceae bacterium]